MKYLKIFVPAAALGLMTLFPVAGSAETGDGAGPSFHIGGGAGYNRLNEDEFPNQSEDVDETNTSYKGYVGGRFNRIVGMEGSYVDFGTAEGGDNRVDAHGFTTAVTGYVPVTPRFEPYGKVGAFFWDKTQSSSIDNFETDGEDLFYGLGARFGVAPRLDFKLEYERYALDTADVDMASANLQFNF